MTAPADSRWLPFATPALAPAPSEAAWTLHLAAIEHTLAVPLAIRDADDLRSRAHWSDRLAPFAHQVRNLLTFCRRAPVTLIADEVGLGKTISAGLILSELMARGLVRRALVLAPKILNPQWATELQQKFAIASAHDSGADVRALAAGDVPVVITTWASARTHMDALAAGGFDLLIGDEAHKLRNLYGTRTRPQFAKAVRDALRTRAFRYVVLLTATPIQNRLWDLYSLIDCLTVAKGHANPLGAPKAFVNRYVADGATAARTLHPGRRAELQGILGDYMVRTRRADVALAFPERRVLTHAGPPGPAEQRLVALVAQLVGRRDRLAGIGLAQAAMSSPEALRRQLTGMVQRETATLQELADVEAACADIDVTAKLARLWRLIDELRAERPADWRCIVFTTRRATQQAIGDALTARGVAVGFIAGDDPERNQAAMAGLRASPPTVNVIVSTDAGAEGVNLQAANVLVNYDLPWNPMVVEQRIGRVQRLASTHATVHVVNLVTAGTVEAQVVARLVEKLQVIAATVGDIEGVLESSAVGDEDGFEEQIRDLVLASLAGQDVADACARLEAEVQAARALWVEEQALVETTLGALEAQHAAGPAMPRLAAVTPRLDAAALVAAARAAGAGPAADVPAAALVPGRPAFEQCVAAWAGRHQHRVRDATGWDVAAVTGAARAWCAAALPAATVTDVQAAAATAFQGTLWVRAAAAVAHDRVERLCAVRVAPTGHPPVPAGDAPCVAGALPGAPLLEVVAPAVRAQAAAHPDLQAFDAFYRARLVEERARAGDKAERGAKVVEHFTPTWSAALVAADGVRYTTAHVTVALAWPGGAVAEGRLEVWPRTGALVAAPALVTCAVTGHTVPEPATVASALSGRRALADRVVTCAATGRPVLPDELGTCAVSGRRVATDQLRTCALSGERALAEYFELDALDGRPLLRAHAGQSDKSGRWTDPARLVTDQWTGARLLPDEVGTCVLSGLPFDRDALNAAGEFARLRKLLDCPRPDQAAPGPLVHALRAMEVATLARTRRAWIDAHPLGRVACVHAETARLFGLGRRDVGALITLGPPAALAGTPVVGRTDDLRWAPA